MNALNNAIILFLMTILVGLGQITSFLVTRLARFSAHLVRAVKWLSERTV